MYAVMSGRNTAILIRRWQPERLSRGAVVVEKASQESQTIFQRVAFAGMVRSKQRGSVKPNQANCGKI